MMELTHWFVDGRKGETVALNANIVDDRIKPVHGNI